MDLSRVGETSEDSYGDTLYDACIQLVKEFIESICKNDVRNILLSWLRYPIEKKSAESDEGVHIRNLKELVRIIVSCNISLSFETDDFIIFDTKHASMRIKMDYLCTYTKQFIATFLRTPAYFFTSVDQKCLSFYSYGGFRFNEYVKLGPLRRTLIARLFEDILSERFLEGRGNVIVMSVIQSEIGSLYHRVKSEARQTPHVVEKYSQQAKNLVFLYGILKDRLQITVNGYRLPDAECIRKGF